MNGQMIGALVVKDLTLYFRNRFFALITALGIVFYAVVYFLMPSAVDETVEIGFYAPWLPAILAENLEGEGLVIRDMASEEVLLQALEEGELVIGITLPADIQETIAAGGKPTAHVYFSTDFPPELQSAYEILLQELAFLLAGQPLNIEVREEMIGTDMAGQQIPPRDRMLPLFAVFILMMETMGLASLITAEVETGTIRALLVTPLRLEGLFVGKGIMGVGLAFVQVTLVVAVTGGLDRQPGLVLVALLLGSLLATGIGFLMASVGKDMMSVLAWGVLAILVLSVPALGVLFPGVISDWIKVIPSYYLVDTVYRVANLDVGWADIGGNLVALLAFSLAFLGLGVVVLGRKLR